MVNQIIKQSKTDRKWEAIISLIIGVISIIPIIQVLSSGSVGENIITSGLRSLSKEVFSLGFLSIIGIILGIKGLKSTKRKFAIAGIVFSIIGLLGLIFFIYTAWVIFITMG